MAVKKHKLDLQVEEDFTLLSLVSDDPDYKLCWSLNQSRSYNFAREDDLELFHKKLNAYQHFALFSFHDEVSMISYRIIRNKCENGFFLEEFKNIDYLVHIQGEFTDEKVQEFISRASAIPSVRMCVPNKLDKVRNLDRLLLW